MRTGSDARKLRWWGPGRAVRARRLGAAAMVLWGLAAAPARAADVTVAAGQEFTLPADVVLTGSDTFTAGDANGARCKILGGPMNFGFLADKDAGWKGALIIRNCDIVGVGNDSLEGFLLTVAGKGQVIIENSTLSMGGLIELKVS